MTFGTAVSLTGAASREFGPANYIQDKCQGKCTKIQGEKFKKKLFEDADKACKLYSRVAFVCKLLKILLYDTYHNLCTQNVMV